MDGLRLKGRLIAAGLKSWDVARRAGIHPTRLSGILNNRIDPTQRELLDIEMEISHAETDRERRRGHE